MKTATLLAFGILFIVGCSSGPEHCCDPIALSHPDLVASVDWQLRTVFVSPDYRERVAKRWSIPNPMASEWTIPGPEKKPVPLFVAVVSAGQVPHVPAALGAVRVFKGHKCSGNKPPGSDDSGCIRVDATSWEVKQTVGYSFCQATHNPNDLCEEALVQVGEYILYSDKNCMTESRRLPFTRWVCLP